MNGLNNFFDLKGKMMKRNQVYKLLFFISCLAVTSQTIAQSFYSIDTIQTIEIVFAQSNWDYMLDTAKAGSEGYIMAQSVSINGTQFDSIGVKYKGNSTYNSNYIKNPLHIELDTYKDQDYQGYTDVKLSNVAKDPSFVREVLSYSILRKYMDVSLSNYANVYINGKLIGLYVSSESVSKRFVNEHFYSKGNAFFKCNPVGGAGPGNTALPNLVYLGADSASYSTAYEINSDYGWADLINLCNILQNNTLQIETVLDVDRALWMIAFDNILVNLDSYIGVFAQNYYLYKDNTARFNCVLWDFNESFGTFSGTGITELRTTISKIQMTHLLHSGDAKWPLVQKLLAVPRYKKMYLAHLQTLLNDNFADSSYIKAAQSLQAIINTSVQADPNKFFSYAQYQSNLTNDISSGMSAAPGITTLMGGRFKYLSALADFTNTKPVIADVTPGDANPKLNSTLFITALVTNTNADAVYLGFRHDVKDKFTKILMYDDGAHGDGASGDNVYGASIIVSSETVQYYVYAENNNVGVFSPVRAEHEFYKITANTTVSGGDIMLNEIYARGTSADPDWIEIYNASSSDVDISKYKIYDSGGLTGSREKKEISDGTIIPSKGFFVIVTDDTTASGFGLSSGGETVWLENSSATVIDSVTFLNHTATQSYGRAPDGGDWQLLNTITRGATNGGGTAVQDESFNLKDFILYQNYPNPFNPTTIINYTIAKQSNVTLIIYDALGREVTTLINEEKAAGNYTVEFDASSIANGTTGISSGIYFYQLKAGSFTQTKKMLLLR
ncbi:MAG: CotH kinase family protein [bacterium]